MKLWNYLKVHWERPFFAAAGLVMFGFGLRFLVAENIAAASAVFALGFFSFFYSNLARFKRFKGLGFEAELWEDKQKEAADLIERLKAVVAIYTREIVMSNVMRGRWSDSGGWEATWSLYDDLANQHDALGQKIDFSDLKRKMDGIFLFDMMQPLSSKLRTAVSSATTDANNLVSKEFGSPIRDAEGYGRRLAELRAIKFETKGLFERAERENIAQLLLDMAASAQQSLRESFGIDLSFDQDVLDELALIARWFDARPLEISEEMLVLSRRIPD